MPGHGGGWKILAVVALVLVMVASSVAVPARSDPSSPVPSETIVPAQTANVAPIDTRPAVQMAPAYSPGPGTLLLGPAPAEQPLDVAVGIAPSDPAGLAARVALEYVPGSPVFHSYLAPATLASRYGPTLASLDAAESYFASYGLEVSLSPDHLLLFVNGSVANVGRAFGTNFEEYRAADGREFLSHSTPADLPGSVPWSGAFGLGNVTPLMPLAQPAGALAPIAGPAAGCSNTLFDLVPCQVWGAYAMASLIENGTNGTGVRIGVVDAYAGAEPQSQLAADLTTFTGAFDLPVGLVNYVYPVATDLNLNASDVNPGWALEDALDLEWARASAPGASIDMTLSPNDGVGLYQAVDWLVAHQAVDVISMSWGEPDTGVFNAFSTPCSFACNATTDGSYAVLSPVLEFAAAEGITVFAASGDCGSADGTSGVATNFPASDPDVTGVGGTNLSVTSTGGYVSEVAWGGNATGAQAPGCSNQGGSGGGYSPFPRPWWQLGLPATPGGRGVPDVALDAHTPAEVILGGGEEGVAGTSLGTPIWAGIAALVDQSLGGPVGFLNPALYRVLIGPNYSADFHDIVSGSNGYRAGIGWDPVTGIGTPIVASLVRDLKRPAPTAQSSLSTFVYASPRAGTTPLSTSFSLSVAGGSGKYQMEGIYFGDGNASLAANGRASHVYPNPGVYPAQSFVVDSTGNVSVSPPIAVVAGGGGSLSVDLVASNLTPAVGAPVTLTATVRGGVGPYSYNFFLGDGTFVANSTAGSVPHTYGTAGGFCAEAVVSDASDPPAGGASARVAIAVGGAPAPQCGNPSSPLTVTPNATVGVRDAPADFPSLFLVSGGVTGPGNSGVSIALNSTDPYTEACNCTIFRTPGNYTVHAWVNDTVGDEANATTSVTVGPPLQATFAVSAFAGPAPFKVYFFSKVKGGYEANASSTNWSFGNGGFATGHSVNVTYDSPGEYLAEARLSDQGDGNASEMFLIDVEPPGVSAPLGITGSVDPATDVVSGSLVQFTASVVGSSAATAGSVIRWNLGDGHSAFGTDVAETYVGPLPASANNGLGVEVVIDDSYLYPLLSYPFLLPSFFAIEPGGFLPAADALALTANLTPPAGLTPFSVYGNASATGPGATSLEWAFDDGSYLFGTPVQHVLYGAGTYTTSCIATNSFGDKAFYLTAVIGYGPLAIAGGPSPGEGVVPLTVTFSVVAYGGKGPPYSYNWTFPNGTHATVTTVTLHFPHVGAYLVGLNATDRSGRLVEKSWTVTVEYPPALTVPEILAAGAAVGAVVAFFGGRGWQLPPKWRVTLSRLLREEDEPPAW